MNLYLPSDNAVIKVTQFALKTGLRQKNYNDLLISKKQCIPKKSAKNL